MASGIFYPAAGGDDGHWWGTTFNNSANTITMGDGGGPFSTFIRFPNVTIPQGSQIDSCVLKVYASGSTSLTVCNLNMHFTAHDDAVAPTTYGEGNALSLTDPVAWDGVAAFSDGSQYSSPDIKAALQDVVDRAGFVEGNAVMVVVKNNGSTNSAYRDARSANWATYAPELHVSWTPGDVTKAPPLTGLSLTSKAPRFCLNQYEVPIAGLVLSVPVPSYYDNTIRVFSGKAELRIGGWTPSRLAYLEKTVPVSGVHIGSAAPGYAIFKSLVAPAPPGLVAGGIPPAWVWTIPANRMPAAQTIYRCFLGDLELPMSSFQARMKAQGPCYLSVVVPDGVRHEAEIAARTEEAIVVKMGCRFQDGTEAMETIARADFESLRVDTGPRSSSATISGHRSAETASPKEWPVGDVSYRALQEDGRRRIRAKIDLFLRPGDTVVHGSESFVVGEIVYAIDPRSGHMEIVEA